MIVALPGLFSYLFLPFLLVDKYCCKNGKSNKLYACFIDLKKAFDTVWHEGMLLKLQRAGINGKTYELIKSMYQGSISRIKSKNLLTEPIMISQGVHQGNVLSPLLFNSSINDIGDEMRVTDVRFLHDTRISNLLYTDDRFCCQPEKLVCKEILIKSMNFVKSGDLLLI